MRSGQAAKRWVVAAVAALVLAGSTAAAAAADRGYGAFQPYTDELVTFALSDARVPQLRALTVRMTVDCRLGYRYEFAATFTVVRRLPSTPRLNRNLLVVDRSRPGTVRARIHALWGTSRVHTAWSGSLTVSAVTGRSAALRLALRSVESNDRSDRCSGELQLRAQREPGVLYVGQTDDDEPVWFRRDGDIVEWLSGFGTECRPTDFFEGIHADAVAMTGPTAFGWPGLLEGFSHGQYNQLYAVSAHIQGQLDGARARGTLRLVGSGGPSGADRCDTGVRRWQAVSS